MDTANLICGKSESMSDPVGDWKRDPMSFSDIPCQVCRQLLGEETFVVLSDGFVHPGCWREEKPSYYETTFAEFLRRRDEQDLVWELLDEYVPLWIKERVVERFYRILRIRREPELLYVEPDVEREYDT
jgi:hypothetical protein